MRKKISKILAFLIASVMMISSGMNTVLTTAFALGQEINEISGLDIETETAEDTEESPLEAAEELQSKEEPKEDKTEEEQQAKGEKGRTEQLEAKDDKSLLARGGISPVGEEEFVVVFDPDNTGSYKDLKKVIVKSGEAIPADEIPKDPAHRAYEFLGWSAYDDVDGNPVLWDFEEDKISGNTTLWGVWQQTHYTVFFDAKNTGVYNEDNTILIPIPEGADKSAFIPKNETPSLDKPEFQRPGYTLVGWSAYDDVDGNPVLWDFENNKISDNTTLWGVYERTHYIVFFDAKNTGVYNEDNTILIPIPEGIDKSAFIPKNETPSLDKPEFQLPGYMLVGWSAYDDVDGNPVPWNFEKDKISENTTLWGVYESCYVVAFDPFNSGNYAALDKVRVPLTTEINESTGLPWGTPVPLNKVPAGPALPGYKFLGWAYAFDENDNGILWDFSSRVPENMTLWGAWEEISGSEIPNPGKEKPGTDNPGTDKPDTDRPSAKTIKDNKTPTAAIGKVIGGNDVPKAKLPQTGGAFNVNRLTAALPAKRKEEE